MKLIGFALLVPAITGLSGDHAAGVPHFRQQTIPTGGRGPRWVSIADVNHDQNPDILVTNADSGTVSVLLGDGRGKFTRASGSPFAAGGQPNDLGIADMNDDGNLDLVIPNHQTLTSPSCWATAKADSDLPPVPLSTCTAILIPTASPSAISIATASRT